MTNKELKMKLAQIKEELLFAEDTAAQQEALATDYRHQRDALEEKLRNKEREISNLKQQVTVLSETIERLGGVLAHVYR